MFVRRSALALSTKQLKLCPQQPTAVPDTPPSPDTPVCRADSQQLCTAEPEQVVQSLSFALRYRGCKRVDSASEAMAIGLRLDGQAADTASAGAAAPGFGQEPYGNRTDLQRNEGQ